MLIDIFFVGFMAGFLIGLWYLIQYFAFEVNNSNASEEDQKSIHSEKESLKYAGAFFISLGVFVYSLYIYRGIRQLIKSVNAIARQQLETNQNNPNVVLPVPSQLTETGCDKCDFVYNVLFTCNYDIRSNKFIKFCCVPMLYNYNNYSIMSELA